jgi:hypothetical protein
LASLRLHTHMSCIMRKGRGLKYAWRNGQSWSTRNIQVLSTSPVPGKFGAIAFSGGRYPCVSYYDAIAGDLSYIQIGSPSCGMQQCVIRSVVDTPGDVGRYNSLALSPDGTPTIASYDATNRSVKCAWNGSSGWMITTIGGPPALTAITPADGDLGATVKITDIHGENFWTMNGMPPVVMFRKAGQPDIAAKNVTVVSQNQIACTVTLPSNTGSTGEWDVILTNPGGQSSLLSKGFTIRNAYTPPMVSAVIPNTGFRARSGALPFKLTIIGTGFRNGATVHLNRQGNPSIDTTGITVVSQNKITCSISLVNAQPGKHDVVVINVDARKGTLPNGFTVLR